MISSGKIDSSFGALPRFVFWRAAANSAALKSPEILTSDDVGAFQRLDTFVIRFELARNRHPRISRF